MTQPRYVRVTIDHQTYYLVVYSLDTLRECHERLFPSALIEPCHFNPALARYKVWDVYELFCHVNMNDVDDIDFSRNNNAI